LNGREREFNREDATLLSHEGLRCFDVLRDSDAGVVF
jgi:hypothetical protein